MSQRRVASAGGRAQDRVGQAHPEVGRVLAPLLRQLGANSMIRSEASSALPGVAVAVALVPPLATVGITAGAGERDLAFGALLLVVTNR